MTDRDKCALAGVASVFRCDMQMLVGIAKGSIDMGVQFLKFDPETLVLYIGTCDYVADEEHFILADDMATRLAAVWKALIPGLRIKSKTIQRV